MQLLPKKYKQSFSESELQRVNALKSYDILDTLPEEEFDSLVKLAAYICKTPISLISFLDDRRQWFKAKIGLAVDETDKSMAFCQHAIQQEEIYEVNDAAENELFVNNPLVTGDPHIRFYAGVPLTTTNGHRLGTLCVIDHKPKQLDEQQKKALEALGKQVIINLELRKQKNELEKDKQAAITLMSCSTQIMAILQPDTFIIDHINPAFEELTGYKLEDVINQSLLDFINAKDILPIPDNQKNKCALTANIYTFESQLVCKSSSLLWLHWQIVEKDGKWYGSAKDITDKKKIKELLTESEERYSALSDFAFEGVAILDKDTILEYNLMFSSMFGYTPEEIVNKTIFDFIAKKSHALVKKNIRLGYHSPYEAIGVRKDGSTFHMEILGKSIFYKGRMLRSKAIRNIDDRKKLEQQLHTSTLFQQAILDSANFSIIYTDLEGIIRTFNVGAEKMLGYKAKEVIGKFTFEAIHDKNDIITRANALSEELGKEIKPGFDVFVEKAKKGVVDENEWTYIRQDKTTISVSLSVMAIKDQTGEITGFLGIATDITDKKKTLEVLQTNQELLKIFIEHTPAAIAMLDNNMQYIISSSRWLADYGISDQAVTGKSHYELFPDIPQYRKDSYQRCLQGAIEKTEEDKFVKADGTTEWFKGEIRPWYQSNGATGGLIIFTEVITQQKQIGENLKANDRLLQGINFASNQLLAISNFNKAIESVLPVVGEALKINRAYIYEYVNSTDGKTLYNLHSQWLDDDEDVLTNDSGLKLITYSESYLERWYDNLIEGGTIQGPVSEFPAQEKSFLQEEGVKSILVIPIFIGYTFWGFLRFDECTRERTWTPAEERVLANFANTVGGAIARNQAEIELINSKNYLNNIINAIPTPVFVKDKCHRFILANDACCNFNEVSREELLGKTDYDLFEKKQAGTFWQIEEAIFNLHQESIHEEVITHASGTTTTSITKKAIFTNEYGEDYIVGINTDITERKKIETALAQQQYLVQALLDNTPDRIYFKDAQSRFIRVSNSMASWIGISKQEDIIGKTDFDFFKKEHAKRAYTIEKQILKTGVPLINHEEKELWPDGKVTWVSSTKMPLYSTDGKIIGTFGITRDITASKKVEVELANSENYLNHIFNAVPIPIFVKDKHHRFTSLNDAWCRFAGVNKEDYLGKSDYDLHAAHLADVFWERDEEIFEQAKESIYEETVVDKNGNTRTVITKKSLFSNEYGEDYLVGTMIDITEIKEIENKLVNYRNYLNAIINAVPDPIFVKDFQHKIILVNDSFCDFTGYKREDTLGKTVYDLHAKREASIFNAEDEIVLGARKTSVNEETIKDGQGAIRTVITKKTHFQNEFNENFIVATITDITERKKAEAALQESENRFRSLVQNSTDVTTILEVDGTTRFESPSFYRMFGYTEDEIIGHNSFDFIHPDDIGKVIEAFSKLIQEPGIPISTEFRYKTASGEWLYLEGFGSNLLSNEAIKGLVINSRDITERKKAEAEIHEKSQMLNGIISNMPVIVFKVNEQGVFTQSIGAGLKALGFEENQIVGASAFDTYPAISSEIRNGLKGDSLNFISHEKNNDNECYFENYIFPDSASKGGLLGFALDITDRKLAEQKMKEYADNLEKINKELDQFAYVVSHDLKAPLRAIANLSVWIEEDLGENVTEDVKSNMNLLRGRVNRMQSFIDGILSYSRAIRTKITIEEVDVNVFLKDIINILGVPEAYRVSIPTTMPTILTNHTRLEQVFSNLISNAIKYHNKPAGNIIIDYRDIDNFYQFSVADDGPGIAPEYHEKIFIIFQTLQSKDKAESTGVGLAIVKKIIEDQGGKIWIESQLGQGSKFIFTLPKKPKV